MLPAFLITLREVIEATLIVATILGILTRLNKQKSTRTVWLATAAAALFSILLLGISSLTGLQVQKLYTGRAEPLFEGSMMMISALFITWAVFWLHRYFARHKLHLLQKVKTTIETEKQWGLFILVFTAVFREGFEIVLFLTTIFLSSNPLSVFTGFSFGIIAGLTISALFFTATIKMPVYRAFQVTSFLLILFAGGLLMRSLHEFSEFGLLPALSPVTITFIPAQGHLGAEFLNALFGWSQTMSYLQLSLYAVYILIMRWFVFERQRTLRFSTAH